MAKPHEYPTLVPYLMSFLLSWVAVAGLVVWVGNADLFLFLNHAGNQASDFGFGVLTYLGQGEVFLAAGAVTLLFDYLNRNNGRRTGFIGYEGTAWWRRGAALLVGFAVSGLLAQGLKRIFGDWMRPRKFFEHQSIEIRHPDWQELHHLGSFPSGHTTTAFCMAALLAFFFPRPRLQLFLLALAWGVALSRIMVGQHFPLDVAAGAMLGTASALLVRRGFFPRRPILINETASPNQ